MKLWNLVGSVAKFSKQYYSPAVAAGNSGTSKTLDWDDGNTQRLTLTGNVTLTLSNPVDGGRYCLVIASGAGGFTVTWPAAVLWAGGVAPVITATASRTDVISLVYVAATSNYYGAFIQDFNG